MSPARIAIIIYTMHGHIGKMAEAIKAGIEGAEGQVQIFQVAETLEPGILAKMHAPPKPPYPIADMTTLTGHDAFLFGIPTRYGNMPTQFKAFWDQTGRLWTEGALAGKYVGVFVSTGTMGGGQEETVVTAMSTFVHHGMIYVPFGYSTAFELMARMDEVRGGSPWGAGTLAAADGSRTPTALELELARRQGKSFSKTVSKVQFSREQ